MKMVEIKRASHSASLLAGGLGGHPLFSFVSHREGLSNQFRDNYNQRQAYV
jgi:hypothetical protein